MFRSLLIVGIVAVFCRVSLAEELNEKKDVSAEDEDKEIKPPKKEYTLHCPAKPVNFMEAFRLCMDDDLQLATADSEEDSRNLAKLLIKKNKQELVWIAGTDNGATNSWIWLSTKQPVGGLFGSLHWKDGKPAGGKHCMTADQHENKIRWIASDCTKKYCYVCQTFPTDLINFINDHSIRK